MSTYNYQKICIQEKLDQEIKVDVDLVLKYVSCSVTDRTSVVFSSELTESESNKIDAIVAAPDRDWETYLLVIICTH